MYIVEHFSSAVGLQSLLNKYLEKDHKVIAMSQSDDYGGLVIIWVEQTKSEEKK